MVHLELEKLEKDTVDAIEKASTVDELSKIKGTLFGKKGHLTSILKSLKDMPKEGRSKIGQVANTVKLQLMDQLESRLKSIETDQMNQRLSDDAIDITLPSVRQGLGSFHPITHMIAEITSILGKLGFSVVQGPEVETDYYNFEALNIPQHHPARDMHDTFYVSDGRLLRTHTSPVQIHVMEQHQWPVKIIVPGKVFRCDADASHSPMFHQVEGLYVNKHVTMGHLKATLESFLSQLFGDQFPVRFRPSYFPFTEPSYEIDIQCMMCQGSGCSLCKSTGWLEVMGAGMVHPNVFQSVAQKSPCYASDGVRGFAFGMGVERLAMLKYKIPDIRLFYENQMSFLTQF